MTTALTATSEQQTQTFKELLSAPIDPGTAEILGYLTGCFGCMSFFAGIGVCLGTNSIGLTALTLLAAPFFPLTVAGGARCTSATCTYAWQQAQQQQNSGETKPLVQPPEQSSMERSVIKPTS